MINFETDTGLKDAIDNVSNYMLLFRDFPIDDLYSAISTSQLGQAVKTVFAALKRIRNASLSAPVFFLPSQKDDFSVPGR